VQGNLAHRPGQRSGLLRILCVTLVLGSVVILAVDSIPNTFRRLVAYRGPSRNPESHDYVAAWVDHLPREADDPHFEPVPPGQAYHIPFGQDLDYFVRRDLSAIKFRGLLGYFKYKNLAKHEFLSKIAGKDRDRIVRKLETLFQGHPRPD